VAAVDADDERPADEKLGEAEKVEVAAAGDESLVDENPGETEKVEVAAAGDESLVDEKPDEAGRVEAAVADDESPADETAGRGEKAGAHDVANHFRPYCQTSVEFLAQMELHPLVGYHVPSVRFHAAGL